MEELLRLHFVHVTQVEGFELGEGVALRKEELEVVWSELAVGEREGGQTGQLSEGWE
jgi:hypothetical protein